MRWLSLFLILLLLCQFYCHRVHRTKTHCRSRNRHSDNTKLEKAAQYVTQDEYFDRIAELIYSADLLVKTICLNNAVTASEIYENFGYMIVYSIDGMDDTNIEVRIKDKILYTIVRQDEKTDDFVDIRILPKILNIREAVWYTMYNELKILIPYNVKFGEMVPDTCTIDKYIFVVPKIESVIDIK